MIPKILQQRQAQQLIEQAAAYISEKAGDNLDAIEKNLKKSKK